MATVQVETRVPGGLLGAPERVILEFALGETLTVRDLIRLKVEEEARQLAAFEALDQHEPPLKLGREYNDPGAPVSRPRCPLEVEAEVSKAQKAFAAGRFLILVNGQRYTRLDEPIVLTPQATVKFIRLMPLTGG